MHEYHQLLSRRVARDPEADELATFVADGFDWGHYRSGNGQAVSVNAPLDAPADAGDTSGRRRHPVLMAGDAPTTLPQAVAAFMPILRRRNPRGHDR